MPASRSHVHFAARPGARVFLVIALAMTHRLGLSKIGSTIHPYPTESEAIRTLGDRFSRTRLTPFVKGLFCRWLAWAR